jgi:UPF0716 protein FxsA
MFGRLLILFITVPLLEILILIKLGETLGFWATVLLVIGTGVLGATLARFYGWVVWQRISRELEAGHVPAEQLLDGALLFVGGVVLLTPGLLTDIAGFLLLIPWTRGVVKRWLRSKFESIASQRKIV